MSVTGSLLLAITVLVPLTIAPSLLLYFDVTPKVVILISGAAALLWFCSVKSATGNTRTERILRFCLLAQGLVLLASTLASTDLAIALTGGTWRRFGFWTQAAVLVWAWMLAGEWPRSELLQKYLLRTAAGVAIVLFIAGAVQYGIWSRELPASIQPWEAKRPYGTLGHAVYFANFLLAPAFLSLVAVQRENARMWRALGWSGFLCASGGIVLSGTRSSILGLALGIVVMLLGMKPRFRVLHGVLLTGAVIAFLGFLLSPAGHLLRSRVAQWVQDAKGGPRLMLWRDSLKMVRERPVLGYGPDTFAREFPRFQSVEFARAYPDSSHESPHNILLDAAVEQGIAGLLVLGLLIGTAMYACYRAMLRERWRAALLGALVAILVAHQFACFTAPTALAFYLIAVLAAVPVTDPVRVAGKTSRAFEYAQFAVAALLLLFAIRLTTADMTLARVEAELRSGDLDRAVENYRMARKWQPAGYSADLWYSRALLASAQRIGRLQDFVAEGTAAAERATQTAEDRQNAYYHAGLAYTGQKEFSRAEQCLRQATVWAPNWYKPYWLLAVVLESSGRLPAAVSAAQTAAYLAGGKNPELEKYLAETRARLIER